MRDVFLLPEAMHHEDLLRYHVVHVLLLWRSEKSAHNRQVHDVPFQVHRDFQYVLIVLKLRRCYFINRTCP